MSKMIQVRHVPDALHRKLKTRAAAKGISLSDYVLKEIEQVAEQPTLEEMIERLHTREPIKFKGTAAQEVRRMRGR